MFITKLIRFSLEGWVLYKVYGETGKWTVIMLGLVTAAVELNAYLNEATGIYRPEERP